MSSLGVQVALPPSSWEWPVACGKRMVMRGRSPTQPVPLKECPQGP